MGLSSLVLLGQECRLLLRKEGEGSLSGCSGIAVSQRAVLCLGFAGYGIFKVSLPPGVECLELSRVGQGGGNDCCLAAMPIFHTFMAVECVFREPGASPGSGKVPPHRVIFHWDRGQH